MWADLLGVKSDDYPGLMRRIGDVATMAQAASVAAQKLDMIDPRHLVGWVPKFFQPWQNFNLGATFELFAGPVDDTVISLLNITSDLLARQRPEPTVAEEQLAQIERDVAALATEIADSELEASFKDYLLRYLQIIASAIADYRIKGFEALRAGLEQTVGALVLSDVRMRTDMEKTPAGSKVMRILGIYALPVTSALATVQLPTEIKKYLPEPPPQAQARPHAEH